MKRVTVLCIEEDTDATLTELRALGLLHLVPVATPPREALEDARGKLDMARDALHTVQAAARAGAGRSESGDARSAPARAGDGAALVAEVHDLQARIKAVTDERERLEAERAPVEAFGDFDPELAASLAAGGLAVRLFEVPGREAPPEAPDGGRLFVAREDRDRAWVALIAPPDTPYPGRPIALPRRRLGAIDREREDATARLAALSARLAALSAPDTVRRIELHAHALRQEAERVEARAGMGREQATAYLRGFCPARRIEALQAAAERHGWGLLVEEPDAAEAVPTLIENPRWLRPVEAVFSAIRILPGYREVDVSAPFLFFLSLFFAMIVGDAGYGLVFLALTALGRRRFRHAPPGPFILMAIFSLCTVVWGVLNGAYFGIDPLPAPMAALQARIPVTRWLADRNNIMTLCLVIGSVHLSIAHAWNAVRMINRPQALSQVGWIGVVWSIYFLAQRLMFGHPFPPGWAAGAVASVALVVLFMTPPSKFKSEWINHAMLPLNLMSGFGDVLSYLRLYALGVAGFKVAGAFNLMVGNLGFSNVLIAPISAMILFAAHALNIALSAMSVLVHGIRLNTLEFSMHLGLEWSGVEYRPFRMEGEPATE